MRITIDIEPSRKKSPVVDALLNSLLASLGYYLGAQARPTATPKQDAKPNPFVAWLDALLSKVDSDMHDADNGVWKCKVPGCPGADGDGCVHAPVGDPVLHGPQDASPAVLLVGEQPLI